MRDFKEMLRFVGLMVLLVMSLLFTFLFPITWFTGHANSAWLKRSRNIDIPWYEAAWLDVNINDAETDVTLEKRE